MLAMLVVGGFFSLGLLLVIINCSSLSTFLGLNLMNSGEYSLFLLSSNEKVCD